MSYLACKQTSDMYKQKVIMWSWNRINNPEVPFRNKDGDHEMLNLCIESQEHIHSSQLSKENIKHGPCDGV
jgi:hypothetical protein